MVKKKVLLVSIDGLGVGGIQNVFMEIVRNLKYKYDFDIVVFHTGDNYDFHSCEFKQYGEIILFDRDRPSNKLVHALKNIIRPIYEFFKFYNLLKKGKYDIVHCHNEEDSGICLLAARLAGVPVRITHAHNTASPQKPILLMRFYRHFAKKLVPSNANVKVGCSKVSNNTLFGDNNSATVIYNAVNLTRFPRKKEANILGTIHFINIGRFCYQKNQHFLIKIFYEIHKLEPKSFLTLVGYGEDKGNIEDLILKLKMTDCIQLLPSNSDIPKLLTESDCFLFPSIYEGLPIALIEAQVVGLKCFVSTSITTEVNLGNCTFLDLNAGESVWAKAIVEYYKTYGNKIINVLPDKLLNFDSRTFIDKINILYSNNMKSEL